VLDISKEEWGMTMAMQVATEVDITQIRHERTSSRMFIT
jgi:hypothetical protein